MVHIASRGNYGVPRVTAGLRRQDLAASASGSHGLCGSTALPGTAGAPDGRRSLTEADTGAAPARAGATAAAQFPLGEICTHRGLLTGARQAYSRRESVRPRR